MNKYAAFYNGKKIEVEAESSYEASLKAAAIFKAKAAYRVAIVLMEKDGKPVPINPASL